MVFNAQGPAKKMRGERGSARPGQRGMCRGTRYILRRRWGRSSRAIPRLCVSLFPRVLASAIKCAGVMFRTIRIERARASIGE